MATETSGKDPVFSWCCTELANTNYSRRCFMSGEYCSKQDLILRERRQLHEKNTINAFVVMSFSSVSDVIYRWKLKSFVEDLKDRLYFNEDKSRLYCFPDIAKLTEAAKKDIAEKYEKSRILADDVVDYFAGENGKTKKVSKINVIRADSSPSTNFVVCNRICQQLQIADLVIVDVSAENANVFYELGMAVALGKMILPICASETYYRMDLPEVIKKLDEDTRRKYEHHIGCFPWRKELFEHFGIRYRNHKKAYTDWIEKLRERDELVADTRCEGEEKETLQDNTAWITQYLPYEEITKEERGFGDRQFAMSPYLAKKEGGLSGFDYVPTIKGRTDKVSIGECIYKKLQTSYNLATGKENTLVLYSMDGFLNEAQAALCIVNYYNAIVRQFREQNCFCGERVGVLLQPIDIPEDPKDGKQLSHYNIGEVIQIGMNQATYKVHMQMVKPDKFLTYDTKYVEKDIESKRENHETIDQFNQWKNSIERQTKGFIRNRCISIYPKSPVYVKRIESDLQTDIFEDISLDSSNYPEPDGKNKEEDKARAEQVGKMARLFYCYYHVMLRTLRYTNEIVVDIGENSLQSFFWLGTAHASDTSAIAVRHIKSEREKRTLSEPTKETRSIFDVSGLWTAVYRTEDAEGFFKQLYQAQAGIEQYSKLILKNRESIEEDELEEFWKPNVTDKDLKPLIDIIEKKGSEEDNTLESYYRNRFWRTLMRCNRLHFYVHEHRRDGGDSPYVEKWNVEAVSLLSNYLSRKNAVSDYRVLPLGEDTSDPQALNVNSICIGNESSNIIEFDENGKKEKTTLPEYFNSMLSKDNHIYIRHPEPKIGKCRSCPADYEKRGATYKQYNVYGSNRTIISQIPDEECFECLMNRPETTSTPGAEICEIREKLVLKKCPDESDCRLINCNRFRFATGKDERGHFHIELAQLVLWRERNENECNDHFRVNISGVAGTATYALASQLVNKGLKKDVVPEATLSNQDAKNNKWSDELWIREHPLSSLQKKVQEEVLNEYEKRLKVELKKNKEGIEELIKDNTGEGDITEEDFNKWKCAYEMYTNRVVTTVRLYLSTVLYRYFLPFITEIDIKRICNGIKMFTSSLRADNTSPFSLKYPKNIYDNFGVVMGEKTVKEAAKAVESVLEKTLTRLCGVEAFYEVDVRDERVPRKDRDGKPDKDDNGKQIYDNVKKIVGITLLNLKKVDVRCLFKDVDGENHPEA